MRPFNEIRGKPSKQYKDDVINIRFKCEEKPKGELPMGDFARILEALGLSANNFYWDVKERIWELLKIDITPILISSLTSKLVLLRRYI